MMQNERLLMAIERQGNELVKRAEFYQGIIKQEAELIAKAEAAIEKHEAMMDRCLFELKAVDTAVDALRDEYKRVSKWSDET